MRITKVKIVAACVFAVIGTMLSVFWLLMRNPPESIADRSTVRARFSIPGIIRDFPVEKYVKPRDSFIYRRQPAGKGWCHWRLEIDTAAGNLDQWTNAFDTYLAKRADYIQRWGGQIHMILFRSDKDGMDHGRIRFQSTEPAGDLSITFDYLELAFTQRMLQTRPGRLLAMVFRKIGLPIDTITWPS